MITLDRYIKNPIITSDPHLAWEKVGAFNGCPWKEKSITHLVYRAMSKSKKIGKHTLSLSTIGYAKSVDRIHFGSKRQVIVPQYAWERYGCEDPRITKLDDMFYIFYTALSDYPPGPSSIRSAVALTKDFKKITGKYPVTPFNSKAMALFPKRIKGKIVCILTAHTDLPPAKICIAFFDRIEDVWNPKYWHAWYKKMDSYSLPLQRFDNDHIEVGTPPVETHKGWLMLYSYIRNYKSSYKTFAVEALLLDRNNPTKIVGRSDFPLLMPERPYEREGQVRDVVFPTGLLIDHGAVGLYYGAADSCVALATCSLEELLTSLKKP